MPCSRQGTAGTPRAGRLPLADGPAATAPRWRGLLSERAFTGETLDVRAAARVARVARVTPATQMPIHVQRLAASPNKRAAAFACPRPLPGEGQDVLPCTVVPLASCLGPAQGRRCRQAWRLSRARSDARLLRTTISASTHQCISASEHQCISASVHQQLRSRGGHAQRSVATQGGDAHARLAAEVRLADGAVRSPAWLPCPSPPGRSWRVRAPARARRRPCCLP